MVLWHMYSLKTQIWTMNVYNVNQRTLSPPEKRTHTNFVIPWQKSVHEDRLHDVPGKSVNFGSAGPKGKQVPELRH